MTDEDTGEGAQPRRDVLRDVAAELRALRVGLSEVGTVARETAGVVSEIAPTVYTLEEQVATLRGTVGRLVDEAETSGEQSPVLDALGLASKPATPWCWPAMDADTARDAWVQLARFVGEVLTVQHVITRSELPDCWAAHPHAVDILSWLRATYRTARVGKAPATAAAEWTTRWFPGAWKTIADGMQREVCGPGWHSIDLQTRLAFESVTAREKSPPPQTGSRGMFRFEAGDPEEAQRKRALVQRVRDGYGPADRPRVMDVDALVDTNHRSIVAKEHTSAAVWAPIWRDVAAADVARRETPRSPDSAYTL